MSDSPKGPLPASDDAPAEKPAHERKLAAILAADVEGYSRLMHEDEEAALATLTAHRAIVDGIILAAHGQIFGTAGDSVLAEFPSVVEAFHCGHRHAAGARQGECGACRRTGACASASASMSAT